MAGFYLSKWFDGHQKDLISLLYKEYHGDDDNFIQLCISEFDTFPELTFRKSKVDKACVAEKTLASIEDDLLRMLNNDESVLLKRDSKGCAPVHLLCSLHSPGQLKILKLICGRKNIVNAEDVTGRTPLHHALSPQNLRYHSSRGSQLVEIVKTLLENGAEVNATDGEMLSPLHLALDYYQRLGNKQLSCLPELLALLEFHGADLDAKAPLSVTSISMSPLHLAARMSGQNALDAIEFLINPVNIHALNGHSRIPLHEAIRSTGRCSKFFKRDGLGQPGKIMVEQKILLLLSYGTDVNLRDSDNMTPLDLALEMYNFASCFTIVKILLEHGALAEASNSETSHTPLHLVCKYFDKKLYDFVPLFLEKQATLNARDIHFKTPFHYALKKPACCVDTIKFLVNSGADPTLLDVDNNGSIHMACDSQNSDFESISSFLVEKGCDVNVKNKRGNTPLLHLLTSHYNKASVFALIKLGADCNARNDEGMSPLHLVSRALVYNSQVVEIVDAILRAGGNPDSQDCSGNTPLHYGVKDETTVNTDAIRKLLLAGANPNLKNSLGMTPLHIVCSYGNAHLAKLLLHFGADPNATDEDQDTPLHVVQAAVGNPVNTIRTLIDFGANVGAQNCAGSTPFMLVSFRTQHEMIDYIVLLIAAGKYSLSEPEINLLNSHKSISSRYYNCFSCINAMKTHHLGGGSITLLNFLLLKNRQAKVYVRNSLIFSDLIDASTSQKYRWYSQLINHKCSEVAILNELHERTASSLSLILPPQLPYDVFDLVLLYLNEFDMNALNEAVDLNCT